MTSAFIHAPKRPRMTTAPTDPQTHPHAPAQSSLQDNHALPIRRGHPMTFAPAPRRTDTYQPEALPRPTARISPPQPTARPVKAPS